MSFEPQLIESKLALIEYDFFDCTFDVLREKLQVLEETWEGYRALNFYSHYSSDGTLSYELYGSALETPEEVAARVANNINSKHGRYQLFLTLKAEFESGYEF